MAPTSHSLFAGAAAAAAAAGVVYLVLAWQQRREAVAGERPCGHEQHSGGAACDTQPLPAAHKQLQQDQDQQRHDQPGLEASTDPAVAAAAAALVASYARMAEAFTREGLDLAGMAETAAWFDMGPPTWPLRYEVFVPQPLPPHSVRLVLVPLAACCPRLAATALAVAADMLRLLPQGCRVFANARQNLHVTVFHFSHPADTRPDSLAADSGLGHLLGAGGCGSLWEEGQQQQQQQCELDLSGLPPPHERPGPTPEQVEAEQEAAAALAASTQPFPLQLERVVLARSGVLLLTWLDPTGRLGELRRRLRAGFPGGCSRQSSIIHTSVFRIVQAPGPGGAGSSGGPQQQQQLGAAAVRALDAAARSWTERLAGTRVTVDQLYWVSEVEFSTVAGPMRPMPLGGGGGGTALLN